MADLARRGVLSVETRVTEKVGAAFQNGTL
jgi:hypothetical protein